MENFPLLERPPELRLMIYHQHLTDNVTSNYCLTDDSDALFPETSQNGPAVDRDKAIF